MEIKTEIINGERYVCIDDLEKLFIKNDEIIVDGFNKTKFANILKEISEIYGSISAFANETISDRTYLSGFINMKLNNPPTPKVLQGIAKASKGITTYAELMQVCGYLDGIEEDKIKKYGRLTRK